MNFFALSGVLIIFSVLQYLSVELAAHSKGAKVKTKYRFTGLPTYMLFNCALLLVAGNMVVSVVISSLLTTVLAIANYYVYDMHGTPFTMDIVKNAGTALNVISAYKIKISEPVAAAVVSAAVQIVFACGAERIIFADRRYSAVFTAILIFAFWKIYLAKNSIVPKEIVTWPWRKIINEAGYISGFVQSTIRLFNIVQPLAEYSEKETEKFVNNYTMQDKQCENPDIIFILNETLYDLNQVADTGIDSFRYISSLKNSVKGYAVCPAVGGGTNKSEYEFLTSNSLYLAPNITPFYSLDTKNTNSVAEYLKAKGYSTLATHPAPGSNYSRTDGYVNLGFDKTCFIEDYTDITYFGSRQFATDESTYRNFIKMYEAMGDNPRFAYLLTIQNHGGYIFNKPSENTIAVKKDFGKNTSKVNEFLSCIQLSDKAFEHLIDYFEKSDRDVVVCMVGDHAPDFAKNIVDKKYSGDEREILLRRVPYVIWSNNVDLSNVKIPYQISMPFMSPAVCNIAGVKPCGYYDYILKLAEEVPTITAYGYYTDKNGKIYNVKENNEYTEAINRYFDFAYSNIIKKDFMADFTQ